MMTVLFLMTLFLLLVLSVDFLPEFWTWQSRWTVGAALVGDYRAGSSGGTLGIEQERHADADGDANH